MTNQSNITTLESPLGGNIRSILIDNTPYFVGKDVCNVLGYKDSKNAIKQHCTQQAMYHILVDARGIEQEMRVLSHEDMLRLILRSKLPQATKLQDWVYEDVLPRFDISAERPLAVQTWDNPYGAPVRTITIDGEPYFVGKDVCDALGYVNANKAMQDHCRKGGNDKITQSYAFATQQGMQSLRVISEFNMYRLIMHSTLPAAEKFEKWVVEEVLPSIRKTGSYGHPQISEEQVALVVRKVWAQIKAEEEQRPLLTVSNLAKDTRGTCLIRDFSKKLKEQGVKKGEKALFTFFRENDYLTEDNAPTEKSKALGLFHIVERAILTDTSTKVVSTTKLSKKGQQFFLELFRKESR